MLKIKNKVVVKGNLKDVKTSNKAPKRIKKEGIFLVKEGDNGVLLAHRKNKGKANSALVILLKKDAPNFNAVIPGMFWHLEYFEAAQGESSSAPGIPVKVAELAASRLVSSEEGKKSHVGMELYLDEWGPTKRGLILKKTFPRDRVLTKEIKDEITQKLKDYGFEKYEEQAQHAYSVLLEQLRDDERNYEDFKEGFIAFIKTMEEPENLEGMTTAPLSEVIDMVFEDINPLDPETFPESKEDFIMDAVEKCSIIGAEVLGVEKKQLENGMEVEVEDIRVRFLVPESKGGNVPSNDEEDEEDSLVLSTIEQEELDEAIAEVDEVLAELEDEEELVEETVKETEEIDV